MYLASEALRVLAKDKESELTSRTKSSDRRPYKKELDLSTKFIPIWVKIVVAIALGLGTMVGWKRIVVTVGEKIGKTHLTYGQGAAAELVATATIGAADGLGLPVSTTHVLSSGVAGTMVANGSGMQWSTLRNIALGWVLTLPAAMILSGTLFFLFRQFSDGRGSKSELERPRHSRPFSFVSAAVKGDRYGARPRNPNVPGLKILERQVHHRRHQRVGIGVVLVEQRQAEIPQNAHETAGRPQCPAARRHICAHNRFRTLRSAAFGNSMPSSAPNVLVEHRDIEFEIEADQRPRPMKRSKSGSTSSIGRPWRHPARAGDES